MLPVFLETVIHERQVKKENRTFASLERFMLFATEEEGEAGFMFYNFATRQALGGRKLPAEAVAEQVAKRPPPPPKKKKIDRSTTASKNSMAPGAAPGGDEKAAKPNAEARLPRPRKITQEEFAALRLQSATVR